MGNQRTIITVSEKDKAWLKSFSKARGISMAEAIRRGIAQLKEREEKNTYLTLVEETSGIWKKGDGLVYQETLELLIELWPLERLTQEFDRLCIECGCDIPASWANKIKQVMNTNCADAQRLVEAIWKLLRKYEAKIQGVQ